MAKRNREFWESATLNNKTYLYYYDRLMELAISRYQWINLPAEIDERFLELTLFAAGHALFFKDEELDEYLALQGTIGGRMDVYRIPIDRRAYAVNGYQKSLTNKDSVIIYNNMLHKNTMLAVELYARKLYNIDRTIDINCNAQKTPVLVQCDENQRLSMKNLYMQYDGNEPFIFGDKNLNTNGVKSIRTDAPFVGKELNDLKQNIWSEALMYLGIASVTSEKRERMVVSEVTSSQGGVISSRYSGLQSRKRACEQINKMFGLNISCKYREDADALFYDELYDDDPDTKVGDDNE